MLKRTLCFILSIIMIAALSVPAVLAEPEVSLDTSAEQSQTETQYNDPSTLNRYDIVREIEDIKENITDRFIIKPKSVEPSEFQPVIAEAYTAAKEAKDQQISRVLECGEMTVESALSDEMTDNSTVLQLKNVLRDIYAGQPAMLALENGLSANTDIDPLQSDKQVITLPEQVDPEAFVQKIEEQLGKEIEYIQPDFLLELAANEEQSPAPEQTVSEPALPKLETEEQPESPALNFDANGAGTVVAVIDTGIDTTHPDLAAHMTEGYDFCNNSSSVYDPLLGMEQAHGTHIAGIIAQTAPGAQIMPLKCFENGRAYTSDLIEAIDYAKDNGASIVNCSWGNKDNNQALREAMEQSGLFFVCAAGNNRINVDETPIYPASFGIDSSISVTSLNQDYGFSYYSNYGMSIDIAAVGRDVESAFPGGERGTMNGSSMSAGFVSGAAAIAKGLGEMNLKTRITSTGDRLSNLHNKLKDGRVPNLDHLVSNTQSDEILPCTPADDFDVHGYRPTPEENWELFSQSRAVQVTGGQDYSLILKENGTVWVWGGSNTVPQKVAGLNNVVSIAKGNEHSIVCTSNGAVYTWGNSRYGALGDGIGGVYTPSTKTSPYLASSVSGAIQVAAGDEFSLVLQNNNDVLGFGLYDMPSSDPTRYLYDLTPHRKASNCAYIAARMQTRAAISIYAPPTLGGAMQWGDFYRGPGLLMHSNTGSPDSLLSRLQVDKLAVGGQFRILICSGNVKGEGDSSYGQLGLSSGSIMYCTNLTGITDMIAVGAGYEHSLFIKSDGTVWGMGNNRYGQLGDGTTTSTSQPVQMGFSNSDPPKEFVQLLPDTDISGQIVYTDQVDEYVFSPIKSDHYTFSKSGSGSVDLYEDNNLILADIPTDTTLSFKYPNKYYFKVYGIGTYSIRLNSPEAGNTGHAFDTTIGGNTYYANFKDGGKLYMNSAKLTDTPAMWLCAGGNTLFYNSQGSLYKYSGSAMLLAPVNAYYIISDGSYLYFSNWSDGGRLYRSDLMGTGLTCVCRDTGTWLSLNGDYLYYYNSLDDGKQYKVLKTVTNAAQDEKVQ